MHRLIGELALQSTFPFFFNFVDHNSLQEMLYKLFHTLLMYSLQDEQDGWRVWVETAAAMHAYVRQVVLA